MNSADQLPNDDDPCTLIATASGRVQGVGYRYFVCQRAEVHGVCGEVRNLASGSVEVKAQGDRASLEALLKDLQTGPMMSKVKEVDVEWDVPLEPYDRFSVSF